MLSELGPVSTPLPYEADDEVESFETADPTGSAAEPSGPSEAESAEPESAEPESSEAKSLRAAPAESKTSIWKQIHLCYLKHRILT